MAFHISITDEADAQLRALPAREQRIVEAAVTARLRDEPTTLTKAIRRLRPNPLAGLRSISFRNMIQVRRFITASLFFFGTA
jgi:mRNA-degrading endonuclease RelE of RelBE toxin-antitoxin system